MDCLLQLSIDVESGNLGVGHSSGLLRQNVQGKVLLRM